MLRFCKYVAKILQITRQNSVKGLAKLFTREDPFTLIRYVKFLKESSSTLQTDKKKRGIHYEHRNFNYCNRRRCYRTFIHSISGSQFPCRDPVEALSQSGSQNSSHQIIINQLQTLSLYKGPGSFYPGPLSYVFYFIPVPGPNFHPLRSQLL